MRTTTRPGEKRQEAGAAAPKTSPGPPRFSGNAIGRERRGPQDAAPGPGWGPPERRAPRRLGFPERRRPARFRPGERVGEGARPKCVPARPDSPPVCLGLSRELGLP